MQDVQKLVQELRRAGKAERRIEVARRLALLGGKAREAIGPLIEASVAGDGDLRDAAVEALELIDADWPNTEAAADACGFLSGVLLRPRGTEIKNRAIRAAAIDRLVEIGEPAAAGLANALTVHGDDESHRHLLRALERIGEPAAARYLEAIGSAASSEYESVVEAACLALAALDNHSRTVPFLAKALEHRWASARTQAAKSLGSIGPEASPATRALVYALYDKDNDVRKAASAAIPKIGVQALDELFQFMRGRMNKIFATAERLGESNPIPQHSPDRIEELRPAEAIRLAGSLTWQARFQAKEFDLIDGAHAQALVLAAGLSARPDGAPWRPVVHELIEGASRSSDDRFVKAAAEAKRLLGPAELE